jgi:two-component system capsular synthesis response regulator RcsB
VAARRNTPDNKKITIFGRRPVSQNRRLSCVFSFYPRCRKLAASLGEYVMTPLRVIVADDHPVILAGISVALRAGGNATVVGEALAPRALLAMLAQVPCDVLVTDYSMPGEDERDGLALLDAIHLAHPQLPIVVVTALTNAALYREIVASGVLGLVDKNSDAMEIPQAVAAAGRGEAFFSKNVNGLIGRHRSIDIKRGTLEDLSPRELEIMKLFSEGMSVSEISRSTGRGMSTVSQQKASAMRKLGLTSDAQVFAYVRGRRAE